MAEPAPSEGPRRFERLQRLLLDFGDIDHVLDELAHLAADVVAASGSCGITVRYEHGLMTVGSSDARAELLDETQYRDRTGPCLQALESGQVVDVVDLLLERRWPAYVARALQTGLRCSLSLPLSLDGTVLGAMNVYGFDAPGLFGAEQRRALELFAAQAAGTLRVAMRQVGESSLWLQVEESLLARTVVDQALGIIMGSRRCTVAEAFEMLRQEAQNDHRRLRDVAADRITAATGHPPEDSRRG